MVRVAEESRALAEDILSSAQGRCGAISDLKFSIAGFLAHNQTERRRKFRDAHERVGGRVSRLASETRAFLGQCDDEQCAVAERLRRAADEQRGRTADGETARLEAFLQMRDLHDQMRDRITRDVAALAADTRRFLRDCHARQRALEDEVQVAANELRRRLIDGDCARREAFGQMRGRVTSRVADLTREVRGQLAQVRHECRGARAAWHKLASTRPGARRTPRTG